MTLLYRDQPKIRLGIDEVDGLINVLAAEIDQRGEDGELSTLYYVGARAALEIIREQTHIEYPHDFLRLFDLKVQALETEWSNDA